MQNVDRWFLYVVLIFGILLLQSCGGGELSSGTTATPPPPPPPAPDFSMTFGDSTLPMQQQGGPMGQQIAVTGLNGFSGKVTISFPNLPVGFVTYPSGPFQVPVGLSKYFTIGASKAATVGSNTITAVGTSGSTTHSFSFTAAVSAAAPFSLTASPPSLSITPASQANIVLTLTNNSPSQTNMVYGLLPIPSMDLSNLGITIPAQYNSVGPNQIQFNLQASLAAQDVTNFPLIFDVTDTNTFQNTTVTVPLTVTRAFTGSPAPTRSDYLRTDENVTGAVYDPTRKLVFATVSQLSEVLVFRSTDKSLLATIPVTQALGIDEAVDGSKVYVGGGGASVAVIDPDSLRLVGNSPPILVGDPQAPNAYYLPLFVAALSNGRVLVLANVQGSTETHVFVWDPTAGTLTKRDWPNLPDPQSLTRSADRSKVLLEFGGTVALYDVASDLYTGPYSLNGAASLSPNGSQIASSNGTSVSFYDTNGNVEGSVLLQAGPLTQVIYSRDGRRLFVFCDFYGYLSVATIDTATFVPIGISPDVNGGAEKIVFDVDETNMVFVGANRGMSFVDVSSAGGIHLPAFYVLSPEAVTPDAVSTTTPTSVITAGPSFDPNSSYSVYIGAPPAFPDAIFTSNVTFQATSQVNELQIVVPPAPPQVANMTVVRSDGWWSLAPLAIRYGPHIWKVVGNAGPASGGAKITIYGFGLDTPTTSVTIGGVAASVSGTFPIGGNTDFVYSLNTVSVTVPPGTPGWADVTVTTPYGTTTLPEGYQYLASANVLPFSGALNQVIYDRKRRRLYLSNGTSNLVHVISADSEQFIASIPVGSGPAGLALTPDGTRLAVVNAGSGTVSVIDPDQLKVMRTFNVVTSQDTDPACGGVALSDAAAGSHGVFVAVTCVNSLLGLSGDLHYLDLNTGSISCVGLTGCDSVGTSMGVLGSLSVASSLDGNLIVTGFYGGASLFNMTTNSFIFGGYEGDSVTINDDGNVLGLDAGVHDMRFFLKAALQDVDFLDAGFLSPFNIAGAKYNPSGSLYFLPEAPLGGVPLAESVDVFDVHRQRLALQIALPEPLVAGLNSMCLDENGSKLFAISRSGITITQLAAVPLSIASVTPSSGSAGVTVTVRGSGFEDGAQVKFDATQVPSAFVDQNTLRVTVPTGLNGPTQITVVNPGGSEYSFDGAFTSQ